MYIFCERYFGLKFSYLHDSYVFDTFLELVKFIINFWQNKSYKKQRHEGFYVNAPGEYNVNFVKEGLFLTHTRKIYLKENKLN